MKMIYPKLPLLEMEMQDTINEYSKIKPDKVLSHDCPQSVTDEFFGIYDQSITRRGLQVMLEIHAPQT